MIPVCGHPQHSCAHFLLGWDGPAAAAVSVIHLTALVLCVVYGVRVRLLLPENAYRTEGRRKRLESHLVLVLVILNEQERNTKRCLFYDRKCQEK